MKRMKKAMGKRDEDQQKRLEDSKPQYSVDHLVKERYPAFVDALRDMDDGLCMVFLFRYGPLPSLSLKAKVVVGMTG